MMNQSPRQELARDFNWKNGQLRRLEMAAYLLDSDLCGQVQSLVRQQMSRNIERYQKAKQELQDAYPQ